MKLKSNYGKYKFIFLASTFAGIAGLYISYKFQTETAKHISYVLYAVWFITAFYVRFAILKERKNLKKF